MIQASVPTARVARFLGDSEKMVVRVYGLHAPDYLRVAVAALDGDHEREQLRVLREQRAKLLHKMIDAGQL